MSETRALNKLAVIFVLVTVWELYVRITGVSELLLPAPSKVAVAMAGYLGNWSSAPAGGRAAWAG